MLTYRKFLESLEDNLYRNISWEEFNKKIRSIEKPLMFTNDEIEFIENILPTCNVDKKYGGFYGTTYLRIYWPHGINNRSIEYQCYKLIDEWYYVQKYLHGQGTSTEIKCDSIDGFIQYFTDELKHSS